MKVKEVIELLIDTVGVWRERKAVIDNSNMMSNPEP